MSFERSVEEHEAGVGSMKDHSPEYSTNLRGGCTEAVDETLSPLVWAMVAMVAMMRVGGWRCGWSRCSLWLRCVHTEGCEVGCLAVLVTTVSAGGDAA